jgi:hypothetical protein
MATATVSLGTEVVGKRVYVTGNSYPVKDRLKAAGCHWDGDRRQWWIGLGKEAAIAAIVGGLNGTEVKEDSSRAVYGKVRYKDRSYYVIGTSSREALRLRLTVLDGSLDFWVDESLCQWEKRYQAREYRGRTEHQTLGGIRRFIERAKQAERDGEERCAECGGFGDLVTDLEDGLRKHRRCCDIEP